MSFHTLLRGCAAACTAALLAFCLLLPAAADARSARSASASADVLAAYAVAKRFWGAAPCGDRVTFGWARLGTRLHGIARWTTFRGRERVRRNCRILLDSDLAHRGWARLCTVVVHEVGHLHGHRHVPRRGRIMSAVYAGPLARCLRR